MVCAVDCGVAVNPHIIAMQMESGIGFGLSAALTGKPVRALPLSAQGVRFA